MSANAHWHTSRQIVKRIVIQGDLVLGTPTHLGNGEAIGPTDMNLLRDPLDQRQALLTGASIAGALRSYLRELHYGYGEAASTDSQLALLFGANRGTDEGSQSLLIVDDAYSREPVSVEIRDGVRIDPTTGTAKDRAKFDIELMQAGTTFPLHFELLIPEDVDETKLRTGLAQALHGFESGEIPLGARKRRGFGRCRVEAWRVTCYDLASVDGMLAWLQEDDSAVESAASIAEGLGVHLPTEDARQRFEMDATFHLAGSLLIRAESESGADAGHLHSYRQDIGSVPILPGTSLAGVVRHRALRIANTLAPDKRGAELVDAMFGSSEDEALTASRIAVQETVLEGVRRLVQPRVKIDRFTGGAYPIALFTEEPVFGGPDSRVRVRLTLRAPKDHEVGLLLLLLKDLWTGDLSVGGERSVGRGRLRGLTAKLTRRGTEAFVWRLSQTAEGLDIEGDRDALEGYVDALNAHLTKEVDGESAA